jgi:hypothetical protein
MAKRTVYVSETATTRTVKRSDVDKLKKSIIAVLREHKKLQAQQKRLDKSVATLYATATHWTVPGP